MTLKLGKSNDRVYLSIVHGYRDTNTGKVRTKTIQSLGYLEDLQKTYDDPVAHFKNVVEEMNKKHAEENASVNITIDMQKKLSDDDPKRKNVGYAAFLKIYHELELDTFLNNHFRNTKAEFSLNSVMRLLVISRILKPASKKKTFEDRERYFEKSNFSLDDVYRALTYAEKLREQLILHIHNKISDLYGRTTELVYYDVTNYYFEIDEQDDLRKKGHSKEHRRDPIVQMGLFMDTKGLPITYKLFAGNTNDCETLIPILNEIKGKFKLGRMIVVADKGMNTASNIVANLLHNDGYVYSQTIRGATRELKAYVIDEKDYRYIGKDYKIKSKLTSREIKVNNLEGKKVTIQVDEKLVAFYSKEYDIRAKAERALVVEKARAMTTDPSKYSAVTSYGAAKYIKDMAVDKKTGEVVSSPNVLMFDEDKLREEEKYDGYYAIITSEWKKTDEEILDIYRGLWRIEETFKVTKSDLETRPVYVSQCDHIQGHFLTCFIALTIARILQYKLNNQFTVSHLVNSLNSASCSFLEDNVYVFDYIDDVICAVKEMLGIDLTKKYRTLSDIKKLIGNAKK